jgi:hypothetical protein
VNLTGLQFVDLNPHHRGSHPRSPPASTTRRSSRAASPRSPALCATRWRPLPLRWSAR